MHNRRAFTLVELLIVIAIIAMMVAIMLPALAGCREAARRAECSQRVTQLTVALQHYEAAHLHFPAAGWNDGPTISQAPDGLHQSWIISLLPHLDRWSVYRQFHPEASVYAEQNAGVRALSIGDLRCPSDVSAREAKFPVSNFAGCYAARESPIAEASGGALVLNRPLRIEHYPDGLAYTLFVGEKPTAPDDLGWMSATRATLRNAGHPLHPSSDPVVVQPGDASFVGGFGGSHPSGAWFAFGDAHVRFINHQIAPDVMRRLGDREDGELLSDDAF